MLRDIAGNVLQEGDTVFFGTAFGHAIVGQIQKLDSLLTTDKSSAPMAHVGFMLSLPASPTGMVGGILKIIPPKEG